MKTTLSVTFFLKSQGTDTVAFRHRAEEVLNRALVQRFCRSSTDTVYLAVQVVVGETVPPDSQFSLKVTYGERTRLPRRADIAWAAQLCNSFLESFTGGAQ